MAVSPYPPPPPPPSPLLSPLSVDLLSGTLSGMFSIALCHPLDTMRVRMQTAQTGRFTSLADLIKKTIASEGPLAFYKGLAVPLLSQGVQKSLMFAVFGATTRQINKQNKQNKYTPMIAGAAAGVANCFVATPIELIRSRLQVHYSRSAGLGPIEVTKEIVRKEGMAGLFTGLRPMIYRDAPGVAAWYGAFEYVKDLFRSHASTPLAGWQLATAGAAGGIAFWVCAFPQDTIKSVIQTRPVVAGQPRLGFFATGRLLVATEGVGRLYRGFPIALARGIPGAASTFWSFSLVKSYLDSMNSNRLFGQ